MSIDYCEECEHIVEGESYECQLCDERRCPCGSDVQGLSEDPPWR
jgi:hypothetical protein